MIDLDTLDFSKGDGLVTVVTQDARSGAVLMIAHADREALERTVATGEMHYRSRSRGPWHKGATSGNVQRVVSLTRTATGTPCSPACIPRGPPATPGASPASGRASPTRSAHSTRPSRSVLAAEAPEGRGYTQRLLADRNLRLKKLGEEASELVTACADGDAARATAEAADLIYHTLVALHAVGGSLDGVRAELDARR
jgi:phosphoribosyl-AMP cyclohydrolase / phosphoribosyl-ATP pyrophosphohydrolase